ncbi:hypothetical protein BGX23_000274 [Mortierella sp. AD031]|nr:hypothetical protein BGX23_000274 [Mortierella sp. AD031]
MQRSHTTQGGEQQSKFLGESRATPAMKRRKSMDSAKFLSPQSALISVSRRKSFDQLSSMRNSDSKSRRSSDASSTASQKTGSSGISRTSNTSMSEHTPDSISGNVASSGYSQHHYQSSSSSSSGSGNEAKSMYTSERKDSGNASMLPSPLTRSISQPVMEHVKPKRMPVSFANEAVARQSLDLTRLAMNQERASESERLTGQIRDDSDSDLPGQLLRRRTMQEPNSNPSRLSILPRHHTMAPTTMVGTHSAPTTPEEASGGKGSYHQQQHHISSSHDSSSRILQEIAAPRLSTSSISSLSGSSTVGRFSRIWSSSSSGTIVGGGKENSSITSSTVVGNWNAGEFGEASGEAAALSLVRPEHTRTRVSMLNRLSGIWSRR